MSMPLSAVRCPCPCPGFSTCRHACMFSHALSYYKYTQVNNILYDLRCNAGGARPIKVRNE